MLLNISQQGDSNQQVCDILKTADKNPKIKGGYHGSF
jgi:hypothetical protein